MSAVDSHPPKNREGFREGVSPRQARNPRTGLPLSSQNVAPKTELGLLPQTLRDFSKGPSLPSAIPLPHSPACPGRTPW